MVSLKDYEEIVGKDEINYILNLAQRIKDSKVVHINSTSFGGGVVEMLKSLVPLLKSVGVNLSWQVIKGDDKFFKITKSIHNALQGDKRIKLTEEMKKYHIEINKKNLSNLNLNADVVIIHDPQPIPLVLFKEKGKWIWRSHIDMSEANVDVWNYIKQFISKYDAIVFTYEKCLPKHSIEKPIYFRYPGIDPLSDKNKPLSISEILKVLNKYELNPEKPIIGQVSRFDPWKDPVGVINLFKKVKRKIKNVQLVMIGSFAKDDPEGYEWYKKIVNHVKNEKNIFILTNLNDVEVNAFQRSFNVAIQMSIKEGFGLTVTEALWKGVPVVSRKTGGIPLQVIDGINGYLVNNLEEGAERVIFLLKRPWLAREMGYNGREHIKKNFLITVNLREYLRMHIDLIGV